MEFINAILPVILVALAFLVPALFMATVCLVKIYNEKPLSHNLKTSSFMLSAFLACIALGFSLRALELGDFNNVLVVLVFFLPILLNIVGAILLFNNKYKKNNILDD